jgi:hypothetical protein
MSTHIVDRVEAIRFPKELIDHYDDKFLVLQLGGDNNCFESGIGNVNGRRARHWSAMHFGPEYQVIGQVCNFAGDCEGGMTRFSGESHTSPESYIRKHRKAIANAAVGIEGAAQRHLSITARIRFVVDTKDSSEQYTFKELISVRTPEKETKYDTEYNVFRFDLRVPDDLKLWAKYARNPAWNSVEVSGPRD